jgi:hypothetical protein
VTRNGQTAVLKHEIGLDYVAYLMNHPNEPIHGLALALKVRAARNGQPMDSAEIIQERALALDDAEAARRLFLKQRELEEITEDPQETDVIKQEAERELREIYAYQKKNVSKTASAASRASHAVGTALKRLHRTLAASIDNSGKPNILPRAFADHLRRHILIPSGRTLGNGGLRSRGAGGCFIYAG